MTPATRRLETAIDTTRRAAWRLRSSLTDDRAALDEAVDSREEQLDLDKLRALDAFVQRYQQTVEHMVNRLYPALYRAAMAGDRPPPARDLFIWLEGHGIIPNERDWDIRIEVRNRLVHEYPLDANDRATALKVALGQAEAMLVELDRTVAEIAARGVLKG